MPRVTKRATLKSRYAKPSPAPSNGSKRSESEMYRFSKGAPSTYEGGGRISKRATRRASEEAYNKREKRYDERELNLLGKGKTAKARRYADRKIAKEERILRRAGY